MEIRKRNLKDKVEEAPSRLRNRTMKKWRGGKLGERGRLEILDAFGCLIPLC